MNIINKLKKKFTGKRILIVGLGLQGGGVGLSRFFARLGAQVVVTDKKDENQLLQSINRLKHLPIKFHLGGHKVNDFLWADIIFKGPSVPWDLPEIVEAQKRNIPVEMEGSFFASFCPAKIIGITGTRGKSTTTNLIYQVLRQQRLSVFLAGNLPGISTISLLKKINSNDWVVMELSSWALSGFHRRKISPCIAVFTNFYPDHLNYYKNLNDYLYDKKAVYLYQKSGDYLIIRQSLIETINLDKPRSKIISFSAADFPKKLKYLRGEHNQENAACVLQVAKVMGLNIKKAVKTISQFRGLPYRQQIIARKNKVFFVNDSTSTTPTATCLAIEAFNDGNIFLILGGNSKNLPFDTLINQLIKVEKIILINGSFTDQILPFLKKKYPEKMTRVYNNLKEAVNEGYRLTKKIKTKSYILFSPGATSFSMFKNEFHRGEVFNQIVKKIVSG